jgi:hypothetical protein
MSGRLLKLRSSFGFTFGGAFFLSALVACFAGCGGADNRPARWSYIAPAIIEPNCATVSCHSSVAQRAGVILDTTQTSYKTLTTRHFVVVCPDNPDAGMTCQDMATDTSELLALLRGQGSQRMPPDQALPEVDIQLIQTWIANGAQNN